jgi:hypothetical protein
VEDSNVKIFRQTNRRGYGLLKKDIYKQADVNFMNIVYPGIIQLARKWRLSVARNHNYRMIKIKTSGKKFYFLRQ